MKNENMSNTHRKRKKKETHTKKNVRTIEETKDREEENVNKNGSMEEVRKALEKNENMMRTEKQGKPTWGKQQERKGGKRTKERSRKMVEKEK
uniref:Uncharacterized protein n=1 Tax=Romanomermis culicivorax TaxID=13658 RepID=A0A915KZA6_ROMCU